MITNKIRVARIFLFLGLFSTFFEDLFRRLIPGNPIYLLLFKTVFFSMALIFYGITIPKNNNFRPLKIWFLSTFIMLMLYIFSTNGVIRSLLSIHSLVVIPLLCLLLVYKLNNKDIFSVMQIAFLLCILTSLFSFYTYFSNSYKTLGSLFGPIYETMGYRFFLGERLYFNSGWLYSAERLAWVASIGISICFMNIFERKKLRYNIIYFATSIMFLLSAFLTGRVTGFIICMIIFIVSLLKMLSHKNNWVFFIIIVGSLLFIYFDIIYVFLIKNIRYSFYLTHASTLIDRLEIQLNSILYFITSGKIFGYGPSPQGISYFVNADISNLYILTEGLFSFHLYQYGLLSIIPIGFNIWIIYLAIKGLYSFSDYRFPICLLLLCSRLWVIKASQMETDTFAQLLVFFVTAPAILSTLLVRKKLINIVLK